LIFTLVQVEKALLDIFRFDLTGCLLVRLTATAHATVDVFEMNRSLIIAIRREEVRLGQHPDHYDR